MNRYTLDKEQLQKWSRNLLVFSAPTLAIFFGLLAQGVEWKKAIPVALLSLYGATADYLKKLK